MLVVRMTSQDGQWQGMKSQLSITVGINIMPGIGYSSLQTNVENAKLDASSNCSMHTKHGQLGSNPHKRVSRDPSNIKLRCLSVEYLGSSADTWKVQWKFQRGRDRSTEENLRTEPQEAEKNFWCELSCYIIQVLWILWPILALEVPADTSDREE